MFWIGEGGLQLECSGLRVDLIYGVLDVSLVGMGVAIGQDEFQRSRKSAVAVFVILEIKILRFAHFEAHPDRIQRNDGRAFTAERKDNSLQASCNKGGGTRGLCRASRGW